MGSQDVIIQDNQQQHAAAQQYKQQQHLHYYPEENAHVFNKIQTSQQNYCAVNVRQAQARDTTEKVQVNEAVEDPYFITTHLESTEDRFLKATYVPQYKNVTDQELRRKQEAAKAISMAFKDQIIGGEQEEDWEKHISDFETLAFYYQLRRKYIAYY